MVYIIFLLDCADQESNFRLLIAHQSIGILE